MIQRALIRIVLCFVMAVAALPAWAINRKSPARDSVKVMTRNLYIGVDIFRIMDVQSPEEIPQKVTEILTIVENSNPPERLEAIADEIEKTRPDLIGLQEVYKIRTQFPGDFFLGNPEPAEDVLFDYLELLLEALEVRGLNYRVASTIENVNVELPGLAGVDPQAQVPLFFDGRVTDRDVILVRNHVETANELSMHYTSNAPLSIGDVTLESLRGFTSIDAWVHGRKYRFVNTHLEVDLAGPALVFQSLQAFELLTILSTETGPVIVVGDFNSDPDHPIVGEIVPPYLQFASAGFTDAWTARRNSWEQPGDTCCNNEFLDNPEPTLDQRIDLIWVRRNRAKRQVPFLGWNLTRVVGNEVEDRTPSGLWPSDHAGVVSRIGFRRPRFPRRH